MKTPDTSENRGAHDEDNAAEAPLSVPSDEPPIWPAPLILVLLAIVVAPFELPSVEWAWNVEAPGEVKNLLEAVETFGDGVGVILLLVGALFALGDRRILVWRMAVMSLGAGLVADILKLLVARTRPRDFDFDSAATALDSFRSFLPMLEGGSALQSFPSAHSATAVGLAIALSWLAPSGRLYFALLAFGVMCQRIQCSAHWPSDTLVGAAIGLLFARLCLPGRPIGRFFDRIESR